jgi:mono/diheme cytochrome c family protein
MLRNRSLLAMALAMTLALPASVRAEGDATKGRQIAIDHCSRCHVIPDHNPYGGIGSTPSLRLLARRDDYLERFQTFYARRPHPVFVRVPDVPPPSDDPAFIATFEITPQQIEDLIAYVEAVRAAQ